MSKRKEKSGKTRQRGSARKEKSGKTGKRGSAII
jgi:hypothetical protein